MKFPGFEEQASPSPEWPYLRDLNDRQREAALATEGPLIVLAGAGSGKTKMLISRVTHLIEGRGVPAHHILAVTFTNKAAGEMKERVGKSLGISIQDFPWATGPSLGSPEIGTFHAVCMRILRREAIHTPFTKPFVIYDDSDQLSLVKRVVDKLNIDEKSFNPKALQGGINRLKCDAVESHEMEPAQHNIFDRTLERVYEQYQKDLFANNALDFGEILCLTYRLLRDVPEVRARYQNRYRYIHVDEYQDTNRAQYLLLSMMASRSHGGHGNICVVGDEDQSIYKWRGADIRNILDFENDYPGAQIVKLEQNYRSTQTIIAAASHVIRNNTQRRDKTLWTDNQQGVLISRVQLPDERAEAEMVISEVKRIAAAEGRAYNEFAVFYRTNAQSRQFEDVLRREKLPYKIVGGLRFYDRKEIKDVISYFKVILNPADSISLKRVINTPARGIGKTTIDRLEEIQLRLERGELAPPELGLGLEGAVTAGTSLWAALSLAVSDPTLTSASVSKKLGAFVGMTRRFMAEHPKLLLSELYHLILDETGYVRELRQEATEESLARIENLEEFDSLLQEFEEDLLEKLPEDERAGRRVELLPIFIEQSALASEADKAGDFVSSVNLMTLHSSKGLEFPVVFLVGMEDGIFPSVRPWEETSDEDIEEERRLCYVGITRARERLYLLHVVIRRLWGKVTYQEPSRFFAEIPDDYIEFRDLSYGSGAGQFQRGSSRNFGGDSGSSNGPGRGRSKSAGGRSDDFSQVNYDDDAPTSRIPQARPSQSDALVGRKIQHPTYGLGSVLALEGSGSEQKVTIEFRGRDRRKFLFRYVSGFLV